MTSRGSPSQFLTHSTVRELVLAMVQQARQVIDRLPDEYPTPPPETGTWLSGHLACVIVGAASAVAAITVILLIHAIRAVQGRGAIAIGAA